ncbi:CinA family protein [uncultured Roseobacter sp.]|uniref:CinA family protein n=1 Tax=uncultured Roseobacter sp. TaxID=114847 RepID=UPI0026298A87|nr:CinA family protein [uncultured Roseobacter sp.]
MASDEPGLAHQVIEHARQQDVMIVTAESCTGGMIAAALTDIPGASAVVERGFVTYTNAAKTEMIGVSEKTLERFGAVSEDVAAEMARGARAASHAGLAVSVTGIAGPGGSEFKPEGRVCFGISTPDNLQTETVEFGALGRGKVRAAARDHALKLILKTLNTEQPR